MPTLYVPNVRLKRGERTAFARLLPASKSDIIPVFLVGADQFRPKAATKNKPAIPAPVVVAQEIASCWGQNDFYINASQIPDVPGHPHRLQDIANACRSLGLRLIPLTELGAPTSYQAAVAAIVATDQRGVALRVDLQSMTTASSWIASWPFPPQSTDLLVDFADQAALVQGLGQSLIHSFQILHVGTHWRRVITVGTSMPENFTGLSAGLHNISRAEMHLWSSVSQASLPYALSYGDYATVTTSSPPPGIAWGFPISVRYTLPQEFLICRGVRTKGIGAQDMEPQLIAHAKAIFAHSNRNPLAHCWGDSEIDAIAAGTTTPKGLENWVSVGVNRHLELVRATLP